MGHKLRLLQHSFLLVGWVWISPQNQRYLQDQLSFLQLKSISHFKFPLTSVNEKLRVSHSRSFHLLFLYISSSKMEETVPLVGFLESLLGSQQSQRMRGDAGMYWWEVRKARCPIMHETVPRREELSGIPTFECPLDIHRNEAPVYNSLSLDPKSIWHIYTNILHTVYSAPNLQKWNHHTSWGKTVLCSNYTETCCGENQKITS